MRSSDIVSKERKRFWRLIYIYYFLQNVIAWRSPRGIKHWLAFLIVCFSTDYIHIYIYIYIYVYIYIYIYISDVVLSFRLGLEFATSVPCSGVTLPEKCPWYYTDNIQSQGSSSGPREVLSHMLIIEKFELTDYTAPWQ